jgi:hypothetical protein
MAPKNSKNEQISRKVAIIQAKVLAFVMAVICGLAVFIMTAWLIIKNGPNVGAHLQLLGQYFIGYTVSWPGCFVGMFYGVLVGGLIGWLIGIIYNRIVGIRLRGNR